MLIANGKSAGACKELPGAFTGSAKPKCGHYCSSHLKVSLTQLIESLGINRLNTEELDKPGQGQLNFVPCKW